MPSSTGSNKAEPESGLLPAALADRLLFLLKRVQLILGGGIGAALVPLGIDVREFTVLTLVGAEGPCSQQRLSERLRIDRTTMVALVDSLSQKGLALRRGDPADRRAYLVEITDSGQNLMGPALVAVKIEELRILDVLPSREAKRLLAVLQILAAQA